MGMTAHPQLKVAYVVREFPIVGDERLLDELLALEHSQVDLQVFSLNPSNDKRQPSKAARLHARIGYPPARSPAGHTSVAAATTAAGERRPPRSRPPPALKRRGSAVQSSTPAFNISTPIPPGAAPKSLAKSPG